MRAFLLVAVTFVAVGCSDPVREYNEARLLYDTAVADAEQRQAEYNRHRSQVLDTFIKEKLGFDRYTIDGESKIFQVESGSLSFNEKMKRLDDLEEKNRKIGEFQAKCFKEGTAENREFEKRCLGPEKDRLEAAIEHGLEARKIAEAAKKKLK